MGEAATEAAVVGTAFVLDDEVICAIGIEARSDALFRAYEAALAESDRAEGGTSGERVRGERFTEEWVADVARAAIATSWLVVAGPVGAR